MMKLKSGHLVVEADEEVQKTIANEFPGYRVKPIRLLPTNWFFIQSFTKFADKIYTFECKPGDVFIITFPKSGTTWMQEIIWTMRYNPNLDNPDAFEFMNFKCPEIDLDYLVNKTGLEGNTPEDTEALKLLSSRYGEINYEESLFFHLAKNMKSPRSMKTHLPISLMPPDMLDKAKVIYVARNPKDVCLSYFYFSQLFKPFDYRGTLDQYIEHFINDRTLWSPFEKHMKEAWEKRDHPNMYFVFYEDLLANTKEEIKRIDKFIGTNLTDEQIANVLHHTSFEEMKKRDSFLGNGEKDLEIENIIYKPDVVKSGGGFFRKGKSRDWKSKLNEEQLLKFDKWIEEKFPVELAQRFKHI